MAWYRNIGLSLWRRPNSEVVPPGEAFDATKVEHQRIVARGARYARRLQKLTDDEVDAMLTQRAKDEAEATGKALPSTEYSEEEWNLRMSPEKYLEVYPEGPHAEQAKKLVKQASEAPSDEETEEGE